jgi:hypothetical protein
MSRSYPNLRPRLALGALLAACCLLPAAFAQAPIEPADPLSIRRVNVTPDRVAQEMERLGLTALERLPLDDFDRRLRRARTAARSGPQLVEARYFGAELSGDALVGKGQWKILHGAAGAAVLSLQPLSVAVRQPRFDTRDAIVAEFEGQGAGLVVEGAGEHTVTFDWSARQDQGTDGVQFQLGLPPCPVASLELELPANLVVAADGLPVTGPLPAEKPDRKLWRVTFSRRPSLALTLRRRPESAEPRVLLAGPLLARQNVTPDTVEADFAFDHLKVLSGEFREITCALDPSLRPYEVTAPDLDGWDVRPPATPGAPALLTVRLREPLLSGSLLVRCFAPLSPGGSAEPQPWTAPGVRLLDAVPGGETLLLHLAPDVSLDAWQPGEFRLIESKGDIDGQTLRLVGGLIDEQGGGKPGGGPKPTARPTARVRGRDTDFRARAVALWRVDPERVSLVAQVNYEVQRGRLFRLALEVPAGYEVQRVETNPPAALRNWEPRSERGKPTLLVDLAQPLRPEAPLRLLVWLRLTAPPGALSWPIPDLVPLGARLREGGLAIDFDEQRFEGHVTGTLMTTAPPEEPGPWGTRAPDYYCSYRGQAPAGRLELRPLPPRLRVRASSNVVLTPGRAAAETTLQLQADAGTPQSLDVWVAAPAGGAWEWKAVAGGNTVTSFDRMPGLAAAAQLHILAARDPIGVAAFLTAPARGELRRLTLRRPLEPPETVTLQAVCDLAHTPDGRWEVPLFTVPGAESAEGEVMLHLAGGDPVRVEATGLRPAQPVAPRAGAPVPWRNFRYSAPPVALTLSGPPAAAAGAAAAIDRAVLTTAAEPAGRLLHLFRFQAWGWREPSLPVRLPAGARLLSVKVDGLWVEHVPRVEDEGGLRVDLPVPARAGETGEAPPRRYEIIYATDGPGRRLWARLESPAPVLPLPPLAFLRRWRLPPGLLPLEDGRVRPLPSPDAEPDERARGPRDFGALSSLVLRPLAIEDWQVRQQQEVGAAARAGQPPAGRDFTLGEALERVACDASAERDPLVIDVLALEEAGLAPGTPIVTPAEPGKESAPFWEALGLVHMPCRAAPLLTTRRRRDIWRQAAGRDGDPLPPSVEAAVAEAAAAGYDTSGRFVWALAWSRRTAPALRRASGTSPFDAAAPGWTEWEPLAGVGDYELLTVRRDPVRLTGIALAVGLAAAAWGLRRQPARMRLALLLVWLAVAGGGLLWLPASLHGLIWWPLVVGVVLGLSWYLWSATRSTESKAAPSSRPSARGAAAAVVLALVAAAATLVADAAPQAASRTTILVVSGPPEAPDRQAVLAPRDLLRQIDALAAAGTPRGAVLAGATYEGRLLGEEAEFEAKLLVQSFEDNPVTLALPFTDVRLQGDAMLDGARAFLVAAPPGQPGLVLKVEKPGAHVLVLHFRASVTANGAERELRFRVPRAPQSQLALAVPAGATSFQALVRQGSLGTQAAPAGTTGTRYAIELGRVDAPLVCRWHEPAGALPAPALRVQEAYLWSLRPEAAGLTAVLHGNVTQGALTSLTFDIPEALEVQGAQARPPEVGRPAPPLKGWRVESAEGKRRLRLDFATPLTGGVCVVAHLVPRRPLATLATLPVPTPVGATITRGFLAYRAEGVETRVADSGRLRGPYPNAAGAPELKALADLWQTAGEGNLPPLADLYGLQREPGGDPFLQLRLGVAATVVRGSQEVRWRVGARQADLRAVARLTAPGGDLSLVEWEVPAAVVVTRIGSRDGRELVRHWSRFGNHVQVWLDRAPAAADVELEGWMELTPDGDGARFDLPGVRLLSAQADTAWVRLIAATDFGLTPEDTHTLWPLPTPRFFERDLSYEPRGPVYGGRFRVHRVTPGAEARVLTTAEAVAGRLVFTAHVEYRPDQNGGRGVEVRLRHWDGEVRLDAPTALRRAEVRRGGAEHVWKLDLPAGSTSTLTLSGTTPLPAAGVAAPDVTVSGAARLERWFAVGGPGLTAEGPQHLSALAAGARGMPDVPAAGRAEAARLQEEGGTLWKIEDGADWTLRLRPRPRPSGEAPVRVALTERVSAVVDGRRWAHEAIVWLYHEANTDLHVALPEEAHVLGVTVDGAAVTPLQASADGLWVPLPGTPGARRVRLRWAFDAQAEPLDRPVLQRPRLRDAADGPVVWTVHVPAGYTTFLGLEMGRGRAVPSSPALLDLARAEAQYRLSVSLAAGTGPLPAPALALAQRRFYQFSRYAEAGRVLTGPGAGFTNLQGQDFDEGLQDLKARNRELAGRSKFEELRARAEREATEVGPLAAEPAAPDEMPELAGVGMVQAPGPRGDALPERGTPLRWQTGSSADAPRLLLRSVSEQQTRRAAGASLLLAMLLVLVWAVAQFPGVLAWVRAFWPEQVALLGCVGWQTYGPALALLFLIILGVAARLLFLGRRLLVLLHRPPTDPGRGASTGSAVVVEPRPSGT